MFSRMYRREVARRLAAGSGRRSRAVPVLLALVAACGTDVVPEPPPRAAAPPDTAAAPTRYVREFVFVGERDGVPLAVPLLFSATQRGTHLARGARGWLAHGTEWEEFLDETWTTPAATGGWRVLPHGDLRVLAGGPVEIEALVYRRGERSLRLMPGTPVSSWALHDQARYRLLLGELELGGRVLPGAVLETQRLQRATAADGEETGPLDWVFLTDGAEVHLLLAEALGGPAASARTYAWGVLPDGEHTWDQAEIRWLEVRAVEAARRDVPVRWSFRVPNAQIDGELVSLGAHLELGAERAGRRALVMRHTVEGWLALDEEQRRVYGVIWHFQE